ncbi:MAG: type I-B CRISPR-associated protein Cas5 [wastewater metagenome]|nr:type I-B CRISPR-associated protein Cas5 [Candidatus Loosdrechtia aerotolerans]
MKVLAFDIWADYAHFRKFYTTSSPLTFSFPPPSAIAGILGAICGLDKNKNEYLKVFGGEMCKVALRILRPVRKVRVGINLLETKGTNFRLPMSDKNLAPHTQIRTEFIKNPAFRIYIAHQDPNIFNHLYKHIIEHKSIYTVSLGLSELLADFRYIGIYSLETKFEGKPAEINTPVTADNIIPDTLEIETGKKYFKEKLPVRMNHDRIVEKYDDVIFEPEGNTIKAQLKTYYTLENGDNIAFF